MLETDNPATTVKAHYDDRATNKRDRDSPWYELFRTHNWVKSALIAEFASSMPKKGGQKRLLDLGIGRGGDALKYKHAKIDHVSGVDVSAMSLLEAARRFLALGLKGTFVARDLQCALPPKIGTFSRVFSFFTLQYCFRDLGTTRTVLKSISDALEPNGLCIMIIPDQSSINDPGDSELYSIERVDEHSYYFTMGEAVQRCLEYSISDADLTRLAAEEGLQSTMTSRMDEFIQKRWEVCPLRKRMASTAFPDVHRLYRIFVMRKREGHLRSTDCTKV